MDLNTIFEQQTALKLEVNGLVEKFKTDNPTVTQVEFLQDYEPEGMVLKVSIVAQADGESVTRKV